MSARSIAEDADRTARTFAKADAWHVRRLAVAERYLRLAAEVLEPIGERHALDLVNRALVNCGGTP